MACFCLEMEKCGIYLFIAITDQKKNNFAFTFCYNS